MAKDAKIDVIIDNTEAKRSIDQLIKDFANLKIQRDKAFKQGEMSAFRGFDKELKQTQKEINAFHKKAIDIEDVLKNINKVSTDDLTKAFRKARVELNATARDAENYANKKANFEKLRDELDKVNGSIKSQGSFFSRASESFNKYFGMAGAAIASFTGVFLGLKQTITDFNDYQAKVANLSALTGLKGDELDWISNKAKEMSTAITTEGVRITQGADVIVEAFTKMGSAKPELLKDKEALAETTKQAIILSEAAKMELAPAVDGLALTMNQYGAGAKEAGRYVNVLAAGSKEGAAEIPDISAAIVKFGAAAKTANISVEESVGLIEALSEKGIKGEIAGTGLKGMIVKMMSGADEFNPKVVGMSKALDNLAKANLSASALTKMFGLENFTVVKSLIDSRQRVDELTKAVTGTNVAYEQANINTDTNAAKLEQQKNKIKLISIELGEKLAPIMSSSLGIFTKFMQLLIASINFYGRHSAAINTVVAALAAYVVVVKAQELYTKMSTASKLKDMIVDKAQMLVLNAQIIKTQLLAAAKALLSGNITGAAKAMKTLNAAMSGGVWGIVAAAVVALGIALYNLATAETNATKAMKDLADVEAQARKEVYKQQEALSLLVATAANETKSKREREAAIKKINAISPEYLGNLTLENIKTDESKKALERYNEVLLKTARIKAAKAKLDELENEQIDLETKGTGTETKWYQKLMNYVASGGNVATYMTNEGHSIGANFESKAKELEVRRKALMDIINKSKAEGGIDTGPDTPVTPPTPTGPENNGEKKKEWKLEEDLSFLKKKAQIEKDYYEGRIATVEEKNDQILQLEIDYIAAHLKKTKEGTKEYLETDQQLVEKLIQQKENKTKRLEEMNKKDNELDEKMTKEGIERLQKNYEREVELKKIKDNEEYASVTTLEQAKALLKDSMSAEELAKITNLYDAKKALREKYDREEEKMASDQLQKLLDIYQQIAKDGSFNMMLLSPEQKEALQKDIEKLQAQMAEMKAKASDPKQQDKTSDTRELKSATVDIFGFTQDDWDTLFKNLDKGKIGVGELTMVANSLVDMWKSYSDIVSKSEQKELAEFTKKQDKKKKLLNKTLDQGRISQESYNASVEAMDAETERKKAIYDRNAAKRERDIALMSAIVNLSSAIVASFKTDPSGVLATMIGIAGGVQIKKILSTELPEIPGAETGGGLIDVIRSQDGKRIRATNDPKKRGFVNSPTIITGEGNKQEYVIPNEALNNPQIRNFVDFIEVARRNGTLSKINLPAVREIAGRELGGYASHTISKTTEIRSETTKFNDQNTQLNDLSEALIKLTERLDKGIEAKTYLRGPRGIYEAMKEDEKLVKNSKL